MLNLFLSDFDTTELYRAISAINLCKRYRRRRRRRRPATEPGHGPTKLSYSSSSSTASQLSPAAWLPGSRCRPAAARRPGRSSPTKKTHTENFTYISLVGMKTTETASFRFR